MKVLRHNDLLVATRISGPAHNLLGLDFTADLAPYERDLAGDTPEPQVDIETVRRQVQTAMEAYVGQHGIAPQLMGIQYLSTDTPSDTVYALLATEILGCLSRLDELDTFEPIWSPR